MQNFYVSSCAVRRAFFFSFAIWGILLGLFSTARLYAHPAGVLAPPPAAPSNLKATPISSAHINLTWTDNSSDETGFKIEMKPADSGSFTPIATVGANVTSYASTGLLTTTEYVYRVRAYSAGGNSAYSNEASATTLPNIPAAPTNLTATTVSQNQINLTWTDNSNDETGFRIERKSISAVAYAPVTTVGRNVTNFANTELSPNTTYLYRVQAFNLGGDSDYSNSVEAKTLPNLPAAPSNLTATAISTNQIKLTWADNAGNESGFKIERKNGTAGTYNQIATVGANVMSYTSAGLGPNTNYFFRVRAYNAAGPSDYSNEASARTLPLAPAAPGNLTAATASSKKIVLAWTDNSGNETGFKIERKKGAAGTFGQIANIGANRTGFVDSSLSGNTEYFYRVRAYNAGGHSGYSNEAHATTLPGTPAAPGSLTATAISESRIDLAWVDNAGNESGFKIERKSLGGAYAQIAQVGANVTSYSNIGLAANTQYVYRIRAYNASGHSAYSNEAGAIPFNNANLALNKPATASSTDSSSTTSRAVDGDLITYWRSGYVNATAPIVWLRVQLSAGSAVPVSRAVIRWHENYFAVEYELQVSNDGTSWTTVHVNNAGAANAQDFSFAQTTAKFVRLYMKKHEKSNYRILDFEVYANPGAAKSTAGNADVAMIPETIVLQQNYPNPFNPTTQIRYELPQAGQVRLIIYNSLGQEVRRLVDKQQAAGYHHVTWNGRDHNGKPVPSGIYLYRLQVGDFVTTKRMLMAK
jgi:hypothetical protein